MSFLTSLIEPLVKAGMFLLVWATMAAPFLIVGALIVREMKRRAKLTWPRLAVLAIFLSFLVAPVPTPIISFYYPSGFLIFDLRYPAQWADGRPVFSTAWHAGSIAATAALLLVASFIYWRRARSADTTPHRDNSASGQGAARDRTIRAIRIPTALLVLAIAIYGWAAEQRWGVGPQGFSMPMPPETGTFRSPAFRVTDESSFDIVIEADRRPDARQLDCLLGISLDAARRCLEIAPVISVAWQVMENGGTMKSGHSDEFRRGAWGTKVSRKIGAFRGRPGVDYVLVLSSSKDISPLIEANLRIVARPDPAATKRQITRAALAGAFALLLASISFVWLIGLGLVSVWRSARLGAQEAHHRGRPGA